MEDMVVSKIANGYILCFGSFERGSMYAKHKTFTFDNVEALTSFIFEKLTKQEKGE